MYSLLYCEQEKIHIQCDSKVRLRPHRNFNLFMNLARDEIREHILAALFKYILESAQIAKFTPTCDGILIYDVINLQIED